MNQKNLNWRRFYLRKNMKIKVTKELGVTLAHLGVFTHWSYEEALQGKSWLTSFDFLDIADDIVIETPSAFYASNPPTAKFLCKGGLCTIGSYSYTHSFYLRMSLLVDIPQ